MCGSFYEMLSLIMCACVTVFVSCWVGTTMGVFITYIIPSMCYVRLDNPQGKERVLVYCFAAYGAALMVAGTLGSMDDLITSLIDGASPFSCD